MKASPWRVSGALGEGRGPSFLETWDCWEGEARTAPGWGLGPPSEVNFGWGGCGWFAPGEGEGLGAFGVN